MWNLKRVLSNELIPPSFSPILSSVFYCFCNYDSNFSHVHIVFTVYTVILSSSRNFVPLNTCERRGSGCGGGSSRAV